VHPTALDVVVVAYRSRELVEACLESLRRNPPRAGVTITVVDNDSRDGTVERVGRAFPDVRVIESGANIGFGAANNIAIRETSSPYVLALNPDTRMTPGTLDRLLALMDEQPEVGICGCRLEREDGTFDHASRRSFPTVAGALGHFLGVGRRSWSPKALAQYRAPGVEAGPVDAVNGALMLMRRTALDEVGLFDEGYWMYMEDLDLCYRFKEAGWVTWYVPDVTVTHVKAGTSGPVRSARLTYAFHYGMLRFYRKHYAPGRSAMWNAAVYAGIGTKLVLSLTRAPVRRRLAR